MRLLDRYLLRQMVAPFFFAVAALTSIMLLNQIARRFGALVGKGLPWSVIGEVFGLSLPFILAITLPMGVLMAVLYAFTHLAADNEVTAMRASGISVAQLVMPALGAGVMMALLTFGFNDQVLPRSNAELRSLMLNIGRKKPTFELREQVINDMGPAGVFLRASRIEASTGRLRDVTIYDMGASAGRRIIYADSGIMAMMANETDLSLRLFTGSVHQFKATDPTIFQLTYFMENDIRVKRHHQHLPEGPGGEHPGRPGNEHLRDARRDPGTGKGDWPGQAGPRLVPAQGPAGPARHGDRRPVPTRWSSGRQGSTARGSTGSLSPRRLRRRSPHRRIIARKRFLAESRRPPRHASVPA